MAANTYTCSLLSRRIVHARAYFCFRNWNCCCWTRRTRTKIRNPRPWWLTYAKSTSIWAVRAPVSSQATRCAVSIASLCHGFNTSGWPANISRILRSPRLWCISGDICTTCTGWTRFCRVVRLIRILLITISYSRLNKFIKRISFFYLFRLNLYFIEIILHRLVSEHENEKARRTRDSDVHNQYPDRSQRRLGWTSAVGSTISLLWRRKVLDIGVENKQISVRTSVARKIHFFFFFLQKFQFFHSRNEFCGKSSLFVRSTLKKKKKRKGSIYLDLIRADSATPIQYKFLLRIYIYLTNYRRLFYGLNWCRTSSFFTAEKTE